MKKLQKSINIILIAFFGILILIRLFMTLDAIGLMDFDEAKHASEAYEMFKRKAWIAHTYYWEIDYFNSKPPLYYWLTNIMFGLFGANMVSFKLPSAIAGAVLGAVLCVFLYRLQNKRFGGKALALFSVPLFLACYLTMDRVYDFHGFRAGNFDGVYTLFALCAMIFIIKAREDNKYLIPMGAFLGLAFLSKGFNLTSFVFCAICSVPFLAKDHRVKYILYSILTAILVVLPWAALRFRFDGLEFFYHMLFSEAEDKVVGASLDYFRSFPKLLPFRLLFYALLFYVVAVAISKRSVKGWLLALLSDLKEYALMWIWFWVPILFYSWAGSCSEWYIYSSHVIASVLFAIYFTIGINALSGSKAFVRVIAGVLACALLAIAAKDGVTQILWWKDHSGTGGGPAYPFRSDMKEIKEKYGDEYIGSYAYIMDVSRYNSEATKDEFFFDLTGYAEYECDWHVMKGGIDAWENAEDGILVINKDILDQYIDRLAGHVIIHDNGYIYFIHDMY